MLNLSLDLRTEEVTLNGNVYVLSEMDAPGQVVYDNFRFDNAVEENGTRRIYHIADLEPLKVSLCLRLNNELVPKETVLLWPARVITAIADRVDELGNLSDADAKNLQPGTTTGSV